MLECLIEDKNEAIIEMCCQNQVSTERFDSYLTRPCALRAWGSLHYIRSPYHYVDFGRTKLKQRGLNEEFDCESLTKPYFMVCGRDFNKMIIEWVI